jgi:hypothetical protein
MSQTPERLIREMPSATPTEFQMATWAEMPRDEQVRRYQQMFKQPECNASRLTPPRTFWPPPGGKLPRAVAAEKLQ